MYDEGACELVEHDVAETDDLDDRVTSRALECLKMLCLQVIQLLCSTTFSRATAWKDPRSLVELSLDAYTGLLGNQTVTKGFLCRLLFLTGRRIIGT